MLAVAHPCELAAISRETSHQFNESSHLRFAPISVLYQKSLLGANMFAMEAIRLQMRPLGEMLTGSMAMACLVVSLSDEQVKRESYSPNSSISTS